MGSGVRDPGFESGSVCDVQQVNELCASLLSSAEWDNDGTHLKGLLQGWKEIRGMHFFFFALMHFE